MRRILIAGALSLGLLLPQGTGLGLAQDRTDTTDKPAAPATKATAKKRAPEKASTDKAAAEGKASSEKVSEEKAAKTQSTKAEKAADETEAKRAASPEQTTRAAKSAASAEARRGELKQRDAPPRTDVTELAPTLRPAEAAKATPEPTTTLRDPSPKALPPVLTRPPPTPAEAAKDEALREQVQAALLKNPSLSYTARLVRVAVKDGEITLTGQLNTQHEKMDVEHAVEKVRGNHTVHNQLRVRSRNGQPADAPAAE